MATRDDSWCEDVRLQEDLRNYVRQGMKRKEMLDFLKRDFPTYAWSIPTLDRRLRYFNIFYTDIQMSLLTKLRRLLARNLKDLANFSVTEHYIKKSGKSTC